MIWLLAIVACSPFHPSQFPKPDRTATKTFLVNSTRISNPTATTLDTLEAQSPSATVDNKKFVGVWKKYHNKAHGFSFDYPAIYDEAPYIFCGVKTDQDRVSLGGRSDLLFLDSGGLDLQEYVSQTLKDYGYTPQTQKSGTIDGHDSITIDYRFGGLNRFGTFTMFKRDELIFAFSFTAGAICDIPQAQIFEFDAYWHMIETFQFDK